VADERVQSAIQHWAGRFIANGIEYTDFVRTTASISRWEDWLDAWTATAEVHMGLADEARELGRRQTAGEAYMRAAVSYHFSKFVWVLDPELNRRNTRAAVSAMYAAHEFLDPTAERIEAPLDDGVVVANLRRPPGDEPAPLVILIPGLDSTKEEFFGLESDYLRRGMATLSLDGPGQGETAFTMPIRPDYEVVVAAALGALEGRPGLDLGRIGATGVSLGGYYAARSAAFEPRIKAVAGVSGVYAVAAWWRVMPSLSREAFMHYSASATEAEGLARAESMNLEGVAERIEQPCLVVTGKLDRVVPWEETKRISDEAPHGEWHLYEDGTHVCNNIPFKYRPLVADWMRDRLG
jgi:dienelactone hydrolase